MKTYVQQIMLGTACKNEAAALDTLKRIKAAGYDGLELNQFMVHPSSLMVRMLTKAAGMPTGNGGKFDWHRLLSEAGLEVSSLSGTRQLLRQRRKATERTRSSLPACTVLTIPTRKP